MLWPDYAILIVIAISVGVGALRGFIREVFSLLVWVAAFLVAYRFSGDLAALMEGSVSLPSARVAMAFTGLFIAVLLVGGLINYLLGLLVESTGLSGTDRLLGAAFGAVRGLALVLILLLVAGLTPLPADPWWQESRTIARLMPLVDWAVAHLPESVAKHFDFNPGEEPAEDTQKTGGQQASAAAASRPLA
jgi:membrane protein required for colicin V production